MNQEAPFETDHKGEGQHRYAGYPSQIAAMRRALLEVQFGHDITPVV
jgi:hypothetical protein